MGENDNGRAPLTVWKKILKVVLIVLGVYVALVASVFVFTVISCHCCSKDPKIESGYFLYITMYDTSTEDPDDMIAAIVGLTSEGQSQSVIDVPREIDGIPVRYIGAVSYEQPTIMGVLYYRFECMNLKKLYVHDNIESIVQDAFYFYPQVEVMLCSNDLDIGLDGLRVHLTGLPQYNKAYVYRSLYESAGLEGSELYFPANVVFMNNYSDEVNGGYYRLDNIAEGETIPEPPAPEREGYEFGGWYTEPECVTAWDFGEPPTIGEDGEFRLYARWIAA